MSGNLILRWHLLTLRNTTRAALSARPWDMLLVSGGASLLAVYNIASVYHALSRAAPAIRGIWPAMTRGGLAASVYLGLACGFRAAAWAAHRAQAPWLASLPWPERARRQSVRVMSFAIGGAVMPVPALCGWGVSHAVHAPYQGLAGVTLAVCFSASFAAGVWPGERRAMRIRPPRTQAASPAGAARLWRLTGFLDRAAPRWAGLWAQADGGWRLSVTWLASIVVIGGSAATMTVVQKTVWPSVIAAIAGANLVYAAGLRAGPVNSAVLRTSPVAFIAAWWAMARGPLMLSALWFAIAASPALHLDIGAWRQVAGGFVVLAVLNAMFSSGLAASPGSQQRAIVLYTAGLGMILFQGAEYGVAYGALACAAACGMCALLWRQARRRFRGHG